MHMPKGLQTCPQIRLQLAVLHKLAKVNPSVCMYTCSDMRDWEIFEFTFYECHIIPKLMIIYPGNEKLKDAQEMLSY